MDGENQRSDAEKFDVGGVLETLREQPEAQKKAIGRWLDADRLTAEAFWTHVDACDGLKVDDWSFVAKPTCVDAILRDEQGRFSVCEYDRRMRATSGRFFLGMDRADHARDALSGAVIPSWNHPYLNLNPDRNALESVRTTAERASRAVLVGLAKRTALARLTSPTAPCQLSAGELLGPVLDACAATFFGVPGPSAFSLITWARHITWYHFRVHANESADRSHAQQASAQFRAHVLSLIADLDDSKRTQTHVGGSPVDATSQYREAAKQRGDSQHQALRNNIASIRQQLGHCPSRAISDDDVARNLIGVMTGSLTATAKGFVDALVAQKLTAEGRIDWTRGDATASNETRRLASHDQDMLCPHAARAGAPAEPRTTVRFPLYDAFVAAPLQAVRRGSLDSVYRTYVDDNPYAVGEIVLEKGDVVVVWLGGTLQHDPDHLFGIGLHKCPGMDMAKAIMEGSLTVLTELRGEESPMPKRIDGELYLAFNRVEALEKLAR